jgi:hypothetical protein
MQLEAISCMAQVREFSVTLVLLVGAAVNLVCYGCMVLVS